MRFTISVRLGLNHTKCECVEFVIMIVNVNVILT